MVLYFFGILWLLVWAAFILGIISLSSLKLSAQSPRQRPHAQTHDPSAWPEILKGKFNTCFFLKERNLHLPWGGGEVWPGYIFTWICSLGSSRWKESVAYFSSLSSVVGCFSSFRICNISIMTKSQQLNNLGAQGYFFLHWMFSVAFFWFFTVYLFPKDYFGCLTFE